MLINSIVVASMSEADKEPREAQEILCFSMVFDYWMKATSQQGWMCGICQTSTSSKSPIPSQTEGCFLIDSIRIDRSRSRDISEEQTTRICKTKSMLSKKLSQSSKATLSSSLGKATGESFARSPTLTSLAESIMTLITENSHWLSEQKSRFGRRKYGEVCYFKE